LPATKYNGAYLVASGAAGLESFRVMSPAKESAIAVKVDQIDEQFPTDAAGETARMPTVGWSGAGSHDCHISATHRLCALHRTKFPPKKENV